MELVIWAAGVVHHFAQLIIGEFGVVFIVIFLTAGRLASLAKVRPRANLAASTASEHPLLRPSEDDDVMTFGSIDKRPSQGED